MDPVQSLQDHNDHKKLRPQGKVESTSGSGLYNPHGSMPFYRSISPALSGMANPTANDWNAPFGADDPIHDGSFFGQGPIDAHDLGLGSPQSFDFPSINSVWGGDAANVGLFNESFSMSNAALPNNFNHDAAQNDDYYAYVNYNPPKEPFTPNSASPTLGSTASDECPTGQANSFESLQVDKTLQLLASTNVPNASNTSEAVVHDGITSTSPSTENSSGHTIDPITPGDSDSELLFTEPRILGSGFDEEVANINLELGPRGKTASQVAENSNGHRLPAFATRPMPQTPQNILSSASSQAVDTHQQQIGATAAAQATKHDRYPVARCYTEIADMSVLGRYKVGKDKTYFHSLTEARKEVLQLPDDLLEDDTIPQTDEEKCAVIKAMRDHILDGHLNEDGPTSLKRLRTNKLYTPKYVEMVCWQILEDMIKRHQQGFLTDQGRSPKNEFVSFASRLAAVLQMFAKHKNICKTVLTEPYRWRFIDDPFETEKGTNSNKKNNDSKAVKLNFANECLKEKEQEARAASIDTSTTDPTNRQMGLTQIAEMSESQQNISMANNLGLRELLPWPSEDSNATSSAYPGNLPSALYSTGRAPEQQSNHFNHQNSLVLSREPQMQPSKYPILGLNGAYPWSQQFAEPLSAFDQGTPNPPVNPVYDSQSGWPQFPHPPMPAPSYGDEQRLSVGPTYARETYTNSRSTSKKRTHEASFSTDTGILALQYDYAPNPAAKRNCTPPRSVSTTTPSPQQHLTAQPVLNEQIYAQSSSASTATLSSQQHAAPNPTTRRPGRPRTTQTGRVIKTLNERNKGHRTTKKKT
ncbi:hypothetical protein BDV12DRAFT_197005 [Aspergillus spectabilis]